ncbi:MAG TPA: hypothetical protein VGF59_16040, partial [Bryobacteraceae bacterium]
MINTAYLACGALLVGVVLASVQAAEEDTGVLFHDSFRSKLADGWRWVREDPKHWRAGERGLEVHVQPGNMWGPANDAKNVLLRDAPDPERQGVEITAAVSNRPTSQYEQVDL